MRIVASLAASALLLAGLAAPAGPARAAAAAPAPGYTWRNAAITGGGFVDGIVFNQTEPGLAYARTDIGGAYRWDPAARRWLPLMDFTAFNDWNVLGVQSIATDPIHPGNVWVAAGQYTQPWAQPLDGEILRSGNQGRSWQVTGLPIQLAANQPGPNGMTDGSVWKYATRSGTWTNITPEVPGADGNPAFGYAGLATDPRHPGTVMVATNDRLYPVDTIYRSTDGGATWEDIGAHAHLDIAASPFLAWGATPKFGWWIASIAIDPFHRDHVLFGTGATVFGSDDVTAADHGQPTTWSSAAATGIEETAVNDLVAPAAGRCTLLSAVGDLGGFCHTSLTRSPAAGMIQPILGSGESIGEAGAAPLDVAEVGYSGGDWSTDGGAAWTAMTLPPGSTAGAGVVAVSARGSRIIWAPVDAPPAYSTDGGRTWTAVRGLAQGLKPVADPVRPGVFYAFDPADGAVLKSTDGGASFAAAATGLPGGVGAEQSGTAPQLHTVPGRAGDVWLTAGDGALYHSTGGALAFRKIGSVGTVATLGFGRAAPGAGYPAIYLSGIVSGVQGIFRSTDGGGHWLRINTGAQQWAWTGQTITGDPRVFGRVYLGTNGRGILYGEPAGHR